jgi:hypothetical protein
VVTGIVPQVQDTFDGNYQPYPFTSAPFAVFQIETGPPDFDNDFYTWQYSLSFRYVFTPDGTNFPGTASWIENITVVDPVPEPTTLALTGLGLAYVLTLYRRYRFQG